MKVYQRIISLILSMLVMASVLAVPVFAEDQSTDELKIIGPDTVLMSNINYSGIYVPYYIEGLNEGDTVDKWNLSKTDDMSLAIAQNVFWLKKNPSADSSQSKYDALLCLNKGMGDVTFTGNGKYAKTITISAAVTQNGVQKNVSKQVGVAQAKRNENSTQAYIVSDELYKKATTESIADTWSGTGNVTLESDTAESGTYAHGAAISTTYSKFLYNKTGSMTEQDKNIQDAFKGIYTIDLSVRLRTDMDTANYPTALVMKSADIKTDLLKIELAIHRNDPNYEKFQVTGAAGSTAAYPTRVTEMYKRTKDQKWQWHELKAVVNAIDRTADVYIDGGQYAKHIVLNGTADTQPVKLLQFKGVDVRNLHVYSGHPFYRHMDFVQSDRVIYVDPQKPVEKKYDLRCRMADYIYQDGTIAWGSLKDDVISDIYYEIPYDLSTKEDTAEITENLSAQSSVDLGNITVKVKPGAGTQKLPFRIDRGGGRSTYSTEVLDIRNYNFEGFDGYSVGDAAPPEFKAYAFIREEAGTKYIDFNRSDTGKLYIDCNPGSVCRMDLEIRDGAVETADASHNTIQVKNSQKASTNAMFVPETEFTAGTFYFDAASGTYFGTAGTASMSGRLEDLMYLDFGAPLKSLHMKEIEAADCPAAAMDAVLSGKAETGKALTLSYTEAPGVTYTQKWYQSDDGTAYTELSGQTGTVLPITDKMEGKYIKAGVTAIKDGRTFEYFTGAVQAAGASSNLGRIVWTPDAGKQSLTAEVVLDAASVPDTVTMLVTIRDKACQNVLIDLTEAERTVNGDGTITLRAAVGYNPADTLAVQAFVWESMDSMRPVLEAASYTPPVTEA